MGAHIWHRIPKDTTIGDLIGELKPALILVDASSFLAGHGPRVSQEDRLLYSTASIERVLQAVAAVPMEERGLTWVKVG